MSSEGLPLRKVGIYRNLPDFPSNVTDLTALVCGATGISGFNTIRCLLDSPRWSRVYAVSRSPCSPEQLEVLTREQQARVQHVAVDLSAPASDIAQKLVEAGVRPDYVFYYTYIQPKTDRGPMSHESAKALEDANVPVFERFLDALPKANIRPKRILLQTGGKNYGMHIGRGRALFVESDPQPRTLGPNFYYPQEDLLKAFCTAHPETAWNVIRPFGVIGAVQKLNINVFYPLGVYAAVQAEKKMPLAWFGDFKSWQFACCHSTARLTGFLSEWAVLEDKCANQAFNAHDGSPLTWDRFFEELARWYGVEKGAQPPDHEKPCAITEIPGGSASPLGYGPPVKSGTQFSMLDWVRDESNQRAWKEVQSQNKETVTVDPFSADMEEHFLMANMDTLVYGQVSLNKVRRFGFTGFVDTLESMFETAREMARLGFLPPPVVESARPLI